MIATARRERAALGARLERASRELPPARRLRFQLVRDALESLPASGGALDLLDAGAGDGRLSVALARRHPGWSVVGIDVDEAMLERARSRALTHGLENLELRLQDLTMGLGDELYDVVLAVECLTEIADDDAAIGAMARALRPGGRLLAHCPHAGWRPVLPGSEATWRYEVRHGYGAEDITTKFARAGLAVTGMRPTARTMVWAAQEVADRVKHSSLRRRVALLPPVLAAVELERRGVTWGAPRAWLVHAQRLP